MKYYCASCGNEKPEYHAFMHVSGNLNFCKICACATHTYYTEEKEPDYTKIRNLKSNKVPHIYPTYPKIEETEKCDPVKIIAELEKKKKLKQNKIEQSKPERPLVQVPLKEQIKKLGMNVQKRELGLLVTLEITG